MGQAEIKNLLKETNKFLTAKQMTEKLNANNGSISKSIRQMYNSGQLRRKQVGESVFKAFAYQLWEYNQRKCKDI